MSSGLPHLHGQLRTAIVVAEIFVLRPGLFGEFHESLELAVFPTGVVKEFVETDHRAGPDARRQQFKNGLCGAVQVGVDVQVIRRTGIF